MKKIKISLILNIIITVLVTLGTIFMFLGIKFMPSKSLLEVSNIEMFKFFTVDSNLFVGIISLILSIYEIKLLTNRIDKIPKLIYILKLSSTSTVTLTFLVTSLFLAPQYGIYEMFNNSNLLFHLIVPIISIISFVFYEKYDSKYKYALYSIIPMFLYGIYYVSVILMHKNDFTKYDFYGFLQGNLNNIFVSFPVIILVGYLTIVLLIYLNRKCAK